jgi:hypothetical protein
VFALAILCTVALRGWRDAVVLRAAGALLAALAAWGVVKWNFPPDPYYASIIPAAETNFIDPRGLLASDFFVLLLAALAGYGVVLLALRRLAPAQAPAFAFVIVALVLAIYWLRFDHSLHTQNRYYVRTAIFFVTPAVGAFAALRALHVEDQLRLPARWMTRWADALADALARLGQGAGARAAAGAVGLLMLAHAVETTKFVAVWTRYEAAVRTLATGVESDPALGNPRFVSSERIGADLNRMAWQTTTQFLSVLLAPGFVPARLVVDPTAGYFWLTCALATLSEKADVPMPVEGRRLIRVYSCLHRR